MARKKPPEERVRRYRKASELVPGQSRPIKRITNHDLMLAFRKVWEVKQFTNRPGYAEIAEEFNVNEGTLKAYWVLWTKGLLDPGLPLTAEDAKQSARALHEQQLHLLRSTHALTLSGLKEVVSKVERSHARGCKIMKEFARYDAVGMFKFLKMIADMISSTERGYLAALEGYISKDEARMKEAMGREVFAKVQTMTKEALIIQALNLPDDEDDLRTTDAVAPQDGDEVVKTDAVQPPVNGEAPAEPERISEQAPDLAAINPDERLSQENREDAS